MGITLVLLILALVFMLLHAFAVPTRDRVSWQPLSFACLIAAYIVSNFAL